MAHRIVVALMIKWFESESFVYEPVLAVVRYIEKQYHTYRRLILYEAGDKRSNRRESETEAQRRNLPDYRDEGSKETDIGSLQGQI